MTPSPFSERADLALPGAPKRAALRPIAPEACAALALAIVAMPPWSAMGYAAEAMTRYLAAEDGGTRRYAIEADGTAAGVAVVRYPWLKGPYLELLAVLPAYQGQGIGAAFLRWFEQEALRLDARNLWVCASRLNTGALRFYQRHGYVATASLPGLVADGFDEILLRKTPLRPAGVS